MRTFHEYCQRLTLTEAPTVSPLFRGLGVFPNPDAPEAKRLIAQLNALDDALSDLDDQQKALENKREAVTAALRNIAERQRAQHPPSAATKFRGLPQSGRRLRVVSPTLYRLGMPSNPYIEVSHDPKFGWRWHGVSSYKGLNTRVGQWHANKEDAFRELDTALSRGLLRGVFTSGNVAR